ncbi:MAG TPA: hypothetical protein DCE81_03830, partial [Cytophagales bacterium]|nr:hypothetical protein [Cytophagales bacterium]
MFEITEYGYPHDRGGNERHEKPHDHDHLGNHHRGIFFHLADATSNAYDIGGYRQDAKQEHDAEVDVIGSS